jgi:uncharacterized protein
MLHSACLYLAISSLLLVSCEASDKKTVGQDSPSSVWVAEKDGHQLYLAGTIHLLREKDYPLPKVFEFAYTQSKKLIFELPPGSEADGQIVLRMRQLGTYDGKETLKDKISPETYKKVKAWSDKSSYPMSAIQKMRPWFLALTVAAMEYQTLGAEPTRGVDAHFEALARKDGKPGEGLESVEFQLNMFSKLDAKMQEELLAQTFAEAESLTKEFDQLIKAWREGDADKLQEYLFKDADKYPGLMEAFLIKRNESWVKPLLKNLESGETAMVLVGAGHLGGKAGVLELLKAQGCEVKQLTLPDLAE